ncbi:MAG TPA: DUF2232 domain-containing protein [Proteobacteria bacterium]|nr:DUF2232 domain-containing protein [Pseudomonadota bacterium]
MVTDYSFPVRMFVLGVVATTCFFIAAVAVPFFGFVPGLLTMVPSVYLGVLTRHRWLPLSIVVLTTVLLYLFFRQGGPVLGFLFEYGLPAVMLNEVVRKHYNNRLRIMAVAAGACAGIVLLAVFFYSFQSSMTPMTMVQRAFQANLEMVQQVYRDMGMAKEQLAFLRDSSPVLGYWVGMLFPSLLFGAYFLLNGLTMVMVGLLGRWRHTPISWGEGSLFENFAVYQQTIWVLIGLWVAVLLPGLPELIRFFLFNGIFVLVFFYLLQGMAIIYCYLNRFKVGAGGRVFIYFLLFAFHFLLVAVAMIGLFDMWVDFRKFARQVKS